MTIYTINPNTWTKIGDGDCVVISEYKTELVYFRLDNGESVTSYLGKQLLVKNTGDLFAKSHSRTIEVKSTVTDAAVRKNAADIITTNTALTANTDSDLVTKNALEARDALLEDSINANSLADSELANLVTAISEDQSNLSTRLAVLENVPKVVVLTQEDYDSIIEKAAGTLYVLALLG